MVAAAEEAYGWTSNIGDGREPHRGMNEPKKLLKVKTRVLGYGSRDAKIMQKRIIQEGRKNQRK